MFNRGLQSNRTEQAIARLRQGLQQTYPQIRFSISALGPVPRTAPIEMTLSGDNLNQVMETGRTLQEVVQGIPGADNVQLSVEAGVPEFKVVLDPEKMQRLGLATVYTAQNLRVAFTGNDDATLTEANTEYPVRI